jgi:predicted GIY-YIG superfamily endonuclease
MAVYLLHFKQPFRHARHYLGYADNLSARLAQHKSGNGARLMEVVHDAGISWVVARTWEGGRDLERKLKGYHKWLFMRLHVGVEVKNGSDIGAGARPANHSPLVSIPKLPIMICWRSSRCNVNASLNLSRQRTC